jgi:esterase/lipase superfamily enzyme
MSAAGLTADIVAHSMGTRVVLSALSALQRSCLQTGSHVVGELILAAPDVSSEKYNDDFAHLLARALPCVRRVTIYASAGDMVLIASESAHGGVPRAGRNPLGDLGYVSDKPGHIVDVVDATLAPGDTIGHGYFVQSYEMMSDMMWVLAGEPIAQRASKTAAHDATVFCYATKAQPCDPSAGHFVLNVTRARRPGWIERALRSLVPITSPFL